MIETVIVLAAGRGTRLQPLTSQLPKAMVPFCGKPLLAWQLGAIRAAGAKHIVVVRGYRGEVIDFSGDFPEVTYVTNEDYETTNMVQTLLCAREHFGRGFVLAYADIAYEPGHLAKLLATDAERAVLVDLDWLPYWRARFDDPLDDAETLRLRPSGDGAGRCEIVEIGHKPTSLDQIEGQFVGLVGFQGDGVGQLIEVCDEAKKLQDEGKTLPGCPRNLDRMYTTDVLQAMIGRGPGLAAELVRGGWLEIDDLADYQLAERLARPDGDILRIDREGA